MLKFSIHFFFLSLLFSFKSLKYIARPQNEFSISGSYRFYLVIYVVRENGPHQSSTQTAIKTHIGWDRFDCELEKELCHTFYQFTMHNRHADTPNTFIPMYQTFHFNELSNVLNLKLEKFCWVFPSIEIIRFNSICMYVMYVCIECWIRKSLVTCYMSKCLIAFFGYFPLILSSSSSFFIPFFFSFCFSLIGFGWFMSFHFTLFQLNRQILVFC